jgi:hypothetical protein
MVYKPKCSHLFANAMPLLPHSTKLTNAIVFSLQPLWLNECRGKYVDCEIGAKQLHFDSIDNDLHKE